MSIIARIKQEILTSANEYKFFWAVSIGITTILILLFSLAHLFAPMAENNLWTWLAFPGEKLFLSLTTFQVSYFLYPIIICLGLI